MNELQSTAFQWVNNGFSVIPIGYRAKNPDNSALRNAGSFEIVEGKSIARWEPYQKRLPTEQEIKNWFASKLHNIAVLTGWQGLTVLDFDNLAAYFDWITWAQDNPIADYVSKNTYQVITARGVHVYISLPKARHGYSIAGILDVKGIGGYVLVPPSVHPSKVVYQTLIDKPILEIPDLECLLPDKWHEPKPIAPIQQVVIKQDPWQAASNATNLNLGFGVISQVKAKYRIESFFPNAITSSNGFLIDWCFAHPDRENNNSRSLWIDTRHQIAGCHKGCFSRPMDIINLVANLQFAGDNRQALEYLAAGL